MATIEQGGDLYPASREGILGITAEERQALEKAGDGVLKIAQVETAPGESAAEETHADGLAEEGVWLNGDLYKHGYFG